MDSVLKHLDVVVVDCQTSGASPATGQVIELAWATGSAGEGAAEVSASCVALQEDRTLPRRISRITGITDEMLAAAPDAATVWERFIGAASKANGGDSILTVAHFARFEAAFLCDFAARLSGDAVGCSFLCTYEIARRLYPDLPKHTLRALAGFLGYPLPEERRAGVHVAATFAIWRAVVRDLEQVSVITLGDLERFLSERPIRTEAALRSPLPGRISRDVPDCPGVYRFLDRSGDVLYVGKAKRLKQRFGSYFQGLKRKPPHIKEMLAQAFGADHTPCATALEAALLEAAEIQSRRPPYNRALKEVDAAVWYFSPGFGDAASCRDAAHPIGPFPRRAPVEALALAVDALARGDETAAAVLFADVGGETIRAGLARFRELFHHFRPENLSMETLIAFGAAYRAFGRRRGEQRAMGRTESDMDVDDAVAADALVTPERVARRIARLAAAVAQAWSRGEILKLLSHATVRFETASPDAPAVRLLTVQGGEVKASSYVSQDAPFPDLTPSVRSAPLHRAEYDRLRVLATELVRIVGEDRRLDVCLGAGLVLEGDRLMGVLNGW